MADERFEILAAKVLAGEATHEEEAELHALLAREPGPKQEFDELNFARDFLREFGPLVRAIDAAPAPAPGPRLPRLQEPGANAGEAPQVASLFEWIRQWIRSHQLATATFVAAILVVALFISQALRSPPNPNSLAAGSPAGTPPDAPLALSNLLSRPMPEFLASIQLWGPPNRTRSTTEMAIYSPFRSTRALQPLIFWRSQPGKKYEVTITPEPPDRTPPWRAIGVVPPLEFSQIEAWKNRPLEKGGRYRLTIHESGRIVSPIEVEETAFQVDADATAAQALTPQAKLDLAQHLLTTEPVCYGDALAELMAVQPQFGHTEALLKMEAVCFRKMGYQNEYAAVEKRLQSLLNSPKP